MRSPLPEQWASLHPSRCTPGESSVPPSSSPPPCPTRSPEPPPSQPWAAHALWVLFSFQAVDPVVGSR